jgi:hypothetical protein
VLAVSAPDRPPLRIHSISAIRFSAMVALRPRFVNISWSSRSCEMNLALIGSCMLDATPVTIFVPRRCWLIMKPRQDDI